MARELGPESWLTALKSFSADQPSGSDGRVADNSNVDMFAAFWEKMCEVRLFPFPSVGNFFR